MNSMLNSAADFLVQQSWQLSIVFGVVVTVTWGLRNASSHWRYLLWLVVLAKSLTPPLVDLPVAILPQPSAQASPVQTATTSAVIMSGTESPVTIDRQPIDVSPTDQGQRDVATVTVRDPVLMKVNQFNQRQVLVIGWASVVGILVLHLSGKIWATHRRLLRTRQPADGEITALVASLAARLGMRTPPNAYVAVSAAQPFVWGWVRGEIYLPLEFTRIGSAEQRRAIVMHELAHVERWDAFVNLIQIIVQTLFFFHPLIWWMNARIRQEREKCCDEIVLSEFGIQPRDYCEAIVQMLALEHSARYTTPALAVTGSAKDIVDRMNVILNSTRIFQRRPARIAVVTLILLATLALPTAFIVTTHAEGDASAISLDLSDVDVSNVEDAIEAISVSENDADAAVEAQTQVEGARQSGQVVDLRVVHAQTEKPISDVRLDLQYTGKGIDFGKVETQSTDADGRSLIQLPDRPLTEVRVYTTKAGFVPLRVYWNDAPHVTMPKSVTIPLEPGRQFGGTIRNESGKPISGVSIDIHYWGTGAGHNPHLRPNVIIKSTSGKDGRWSVDTMPAEIDEQQLKIYVAHSGYISDRLKRAILPIPVTPQPSIKRLLDQTAVIVMKEGEKVRGQVVDLNGDPIPDVPLYEDEYYWFDPAIPRAITDKDGRFQIEGVEFDERARSDRISMKLTVQAAGYTPQLVEVQRALPLRIELKPGKSVQGRVVDQDGQSVKNVRVVASRWHGLNNRLNLKTETDIDGKFRLNDVPTDRVEYSIGKEGYMWVESFPMPPSSDDYLITLKSPLRVSGTVIDAETGKRLEKVSLIRGTSYEDGRAPAWMRYDAKITTNGQYETTFVQKTFSWMLRVEADGYAPGISRVFRIDNPDKGEVTFDFKLTKAKPMRGTILGLDGQPLIGADVYRATQDLNITDRKIAAHDTVRAQTDANGQFQFPPEVEPFCLVVVHEDGVAMVTEDEFRQAAPRIPIHPWTKKNQTLQIIRKPAPGQWVDFPVKSR